QRDLGDARHLHHGLVAELLHQVGYDLLAVVLLQASHFDFLISPREGPSGVHHFAVGLEDAHLAAVLERLHADAVALARGRVEQHHVRLVDRHRLVDDAACLALHRVGAHVLLHDVHALDDQVRVVDAAQHRAALALVTSGDDDHFIALSDLAHQITSGASETIFMKRSVRSSRVTGPKMRVPIGSSLALSSTAALPSKRISEPSWRRTPLAVRTTTAL